jgi:hypothetical protein
MVVRAGESERFGRTSWGARPLRKARRVTTPKTRPLWPTLKASRLQHRLKDCHREILVDFLAALARYCCDFKCSRSAACRPSEFRDSRRGRACQPHIAPQNLFRKQKAMLLMFLAWLPFPLPNVLKRG